MAQEPDPQSAEALVGALRSQTWTGSLWTTRTSRRCSRPSIFKPSYDRSKRELTDP